MQLCLFPLPCVHSSCPILTGEEEQTSYKMLWILLSWRQSMKEVKIKVALSLGLSPALSLTSLCDSASVSLTPFPHLWHGNDSDQEGICSHMWEEQSLVFARHFVSPGPVPSASYTSICSFPATAERWVPLQLSPLGHTPQILRTMSTANHIL